MPTAAHPEGYQPEDQGDLCADCYRPVWFESSSHTWFHVDPNHRCFLSDGKQPPKEVVREIQEVVFRRGLSR